MTFTRTPGRPRKLALASLGLGVALATVLAGCSADGENETIESDVPWGASAADYQAALADMDPVELIVQATGTSAEDPYMAHLHAFLDRVTEYSGDKITFDVTYANGIVSVLEVDDALVDGRIDIASFWPQYDPSEYPVNNLLVDATVVRDPRMITGFYSIMAAMQEVGLTTPEAVAEWTNKGITPLNIMSPDGPTVIICREPIDSLSDFTGRQIRSGGTVHSRQIEELGAIPVSLPYPEVYEALQRGILDCSMSAHALATSSGHLEVAPYVYHTEQHSFASTPTNFYAGPRLKSLPAAAQQLIVESGPMFPAVNFELGLQRIFEESGVLAAQHGGGFFDFPAEVEEKLAEVNEGILADLEASTQFDGAAFVERLTAANDKWIALVNELGYVDSGSMSTFPDWYEGAFPYEPWYEAVVEEIISQYPPL